jgi:Yip1-like protein
MALIDRVKNIIVAPKAEWDVIAAEVTPNAQLITGYVLPLAAVAAIAGFIGASVVGTSMPMMGTVRLGIAWGLGSAILKVVMAVVMVFVLGYIIDALAPTFGAQKSLPQALKVAAYAYTPVWVASIFTILPMLGIVVLVGAIYAIYLLFLGLPRVMHGPQDKAAGYTALVVVVGIVIWLIVGAITAAIVALGAPGIGPFGAGHVSNGVTYDRDSAMGKLDAYSKKMEEASRRMEAASKSGDSGKQAEAAMAALGTALSGGTGVDPVQLDQLKPLIPDRLAGLPRTDLRTDRSGVKGLMVAKAEATYGEANGKRIHLEITDTGGAAGLMGLASWMGVQGEHEDSNRREVTRNDNGRLVHEQVDKHGGMNKYSVVVGERFVVSASGAGVDIDTLRSGVESVDIGKLAAK